jgi:hypothetical protein
MTWGTTAAVVSITAGVNAISGGKITNALGLGPDGSPAEAGITAQKKGDPFSPYRANLAKQYYGDLKEGQNLDITKMPGYTQFQTGVMDPALEASKRTSAASGMMRSGNEQIALESTAQKGYYGFMTDYLNRLAQGSGAVNNPAQAAALGVGQENLAQAGIMQGMGAISTGLAGLYKSSANPTFNDNSGWSNGGNGQINVDGYSGSIGGYFGTPAPAPATVDSGIIYT